MRTILLSMLTGTCLLLTTACSTAPIPTMGPTPAPAQTATASRVPPRATRTIAVTPTPEPVPQVLRINLPARPDMLDPQKAFSPGAIAVLQLAYEGLTRLDENGHVEPGAADKWEFSGDGKSLTFHLRAGLVRADGTPLVAKDFEYAFKHAVDPRVGSPNESFLDDVHGAMAAYSLDPKAKAEEIQRALDGVGVKAVDDSTLIVSFDQPTGYWPTIASMCIGWPPDKNKVEAEPDTWWTKAENHNGNGPFRIAEITDQVIKLIPNPNYWGGRPRLDRIEFYWATDHAAALASFRKGDLDIVRIGSEELAQVRADPVLSKELVITPIPQVAYLGFNMKQAPFTDKNVRKAFSLALDRESLIHDVLKGGGKPFLSWIPPGNPGYDESAVVPGYDPAAAVQTLIDGGYGTPDKKKVDCNKLGVLKLSFSNTARDQSFFQSLAGDLMRVFACPVLLDPIDPGTYTIMIQDPRTAPQLFFITWQEEYAHPQDWLFLQTCTGVFAKRIGYCDKEFDNALNAANEELDFDAAMLKYKAAQKILVSDLAQAFMWRSESAFLVKPYVVGLGQGAGMVWPGQSGPVLTYGINTQGVGSGHPAQ